MCKVGAYLVASDNSNGNLGIGNATETIWGDSPTEMGSGLPFVNLGTGVVAVQITAGAGFACALLSGGSVKCWGCALFVRERGSTDTECGSDNSNGNLGLGDTTDRGATAASMGDGLPFVDLGSIPQPQRAVAITATEFVVCVVLTNGLKCWGCVCL